MKSPFKSIWLASACAMVLGLLSCGTKPTSSDVAAIDLTRPKVETKIDLKRVEKPVEAGSEAAAKVTVHAANNSAKIKELELELLAAKSHTDKLSALSALLRESESTTRKELATTVQTLAESYEKQRIRWMVGVATMKDNNAKLRSANDKVESSLAHARNLLVEERENVVRAEKEREQEKNAADAYRLKFVTLKKEADKLKRDSAKYKSHYDSRWERGIKTVLWTLAVVAALFIWQWFSSPLGITKKFARGLLFNKS